MPSVRTLLAEHPQLQTPDADTPRGTHFASRTITEALNDLCHPAQLDVLRRMGKQLEP